MLLLLLLLLLCIIFQAVIYTTHLRQRTHTIIQAAESEGAIMHISIEGRPDIQLGLLYKIQERKQI
jgi:hypothetical protein